MDAIGWIVGSSGVAAVGGLALFWRGVRGRVVDDHPVCRRCGYDQTGRPEGAAVCAECGASLDRRRAIRVGNRERRGWSLAAGLLIGLIGVGMLGTVGYVLARGADYNRYKPMWWLVRDVRGPSDALADAAYAELDARTREGRVDEADARALAGGLTALQADPVRRWDTRGGVLLMRLHANGPLRDDAWDSFCRAAVPWRIELPPEVSRGGPVRLSVRPVVPPEVNPRGTGWGVRAFLISGEVGSRPTEMRHTTVGCLNLQAGGNVGRSGNGTFPLTLAADEWARVGDGPLPVRCVIEFRMGDLNPGRASASSWWTGRVTIQGTIRVTPAVAEARAKG